jgi:hypothetical protein
MWKHVALLVVTIAAFAFSTVMMSRALGPESPWIAFMLFWCFLGVARFADPIFHIRLPKGLRDVRPWELRGDVYRRLAVPAFGTLLKDTPLRFANTTVYVSGSRKDLPRTLRQVESAEACHFWAAVLLMPYLVYCAWQGKWGVLGGFVILQLLANVYPIMHLRSVRGRLERVRRRFDGS